MKHNLTAEDRLKFALASKLVLRALERSDSTLTYQQFAEAIGSKTRRELWCIRYREQIKEVLDLLDDVERASHDFRSHFHRVVNAETGQPGAGFHRVAA